MNIDNFCYAADNPLRNRTSCLHAPPSNLIQFQPGSTHIQWWVT